MYRRFYVAWLTACLLTGLAASVVAQSVTTTLSGHVTDASTGKPMPFANVYLNGTTRGTLTDAKGSFSLTGLPLGTVEIVASFVGYQPDKRLFRLDNAEPKTADFRLKPDDRMLANVTVRAKRKDRTWQRQFRRFSQQLLGEPFGGQCLITNSYSLNFTEENGHLKATATEPLIIENQATGYRLHYDLLYFDGFLGGVYFAGNSRFEELTATDERQASRFRRNRMRAYQGSLRHLMVSLVNGSYEKNGFLVYREDLTKPLTTQGTPATLYDALHRYKHLLPISIDTLIRPGKLAFERRLISAMPIVVFYTGASSAFSPYRDARHAYSQLTLPKGEMQLTEDGSITTPNGFEVKGSLADDRLSTLLPADWKPDGTIPSSSEATDAILITQGQLLPSDARLNRISDAFTERFRQPAPTLFVHIDKPFYATGDRLWLSAYLLDTPSHRRPLGETALQVDLLSPTGRLVQHQWLHVTDGRAMGNFRLSDSLTSGTYRLRAYTDEDDGQHRPAFERSVAVYNLFPHEEPTAPQATQTPLDVQVLPEGGRWLAGIASRLGIKVIGPDGLGRRVSGRIVNDAGVEVNRFATNAYGMSSVVVTPLAGRKYYAEVAYDGQNQLTAIPPAEPEGLALSADMVTDTNRLTLQIAHVGGLAADSVYVLFQHRGQVTDGRKILLQNGLARLSLPVATLPTGLIQITLYDATARPQAERLVFLPQRVPPVRVIMGLNKTRYQPREQAILSLHVNNDGLPEMAALSASITDAGQVPDDTAEATIQTHLLLTGELRGRVEQPEFYLKTNTPETRRAVDDLLLTQGWRRVSGTPATELLGGVSLMGRVLNVQNRPIAGAQVIVASTAPGQSFVKSAGTDERGRFRLAGLAIADTLQLMTQLTDRQLKDIPAKDARLVLEKAGQTWQRDTTNSVPNWAALRAQLEAAKVRQEANADLYRDKTVKVLKEVIVRARKLDERPDDIQRRSLHGAADATVIFDETANQFPNLYEMIRGRLAGVNVLRLITSSGDAYRVVVRGVNSIMGSTSPLFLLDGTPIQDTDGTALLTFNPSDIERVELLKNAGTAGMYGVRGGSGVIAFYSKNWRASQSGTKPKAGMRPIRVIGYPSVQREFYIPRYDSKPDEAQSDGSSRIDRRDVLYWKPLIQTDSEGHSQLIFPLSDVVRTLRVTIQGITAEGHPVVSVALMRVQ